MAWSYTWHGGHQNQKPDLFPESSGHKKILHLFLLRDITETAAEPPESEEGETSEKMMTMVSEAVVTTGSPRGADP